MQPNTNVDSLEFIFKIGFVIMYLIYGDKIVYVKDIFHFKLLSGEV